GVLGLEGAVAQIAPEHGEQSELVRLLKHLGDFLQLTLRFLRSKINRRADASRAHIKRLAHASKTNLIEAVGIRDELVVIQLHDEWDFVCVLACDRAKHAERRGHGVTATL